MDESPPQPHVQKQRRVLSDNYLHKVASIGVREKRHLFRLKVDWKEFKDVFEVVETLKADKLDNLSVQKGKTYTGFSEAKMEFTMQNEFQVSPEMMDYEDDHFPKCLPGGNSLFNKHLDNLQVSPSNSLFGNTTVSKSSFTSGTGNVRKSGRKHEQPNVTLLQKLESGIGAESLGETGLYNLRKFSRSQLELNKEGCSPLTRIVVLKPKHGKAENSARCFPSLSSLDVSHSSDSKCTEFSSLGSGKVHVPVKKRKNLAYDMEPISLRSKASREIKGKLGIDTGCNKTNIDTKVSWLGSRGCNSIVVESELTRPPSLREQSFSYSDESYVAKEARKQLSEQGKMTKECEEVGMAGRGTTLGNLLSMPGHKTGPRKLDYKLGRHFHPKRKLVTRDIKNLDLSKFRTQQDKYETLCNEWNLIRKGSIKLGQHKSREYRFNQNDGFRPIKLRSICKKFQSFPGLESKGNHAVENASRNSEKWQSGARACISVDKNDDSFCHVTDTSIQQETSYKQSSFLLHCSTTQPDCMVSLEEAYQPSPVSVLEPPFRGERSPTPEYLGELNVDISEYSDTYSEGSGVVSSDDDTNEGSASNYRENEDLMRLFRVEESRDFSYLVDVLSEIGLYDRHSTMDFGTWHSPEWPVSLSVFETLEKKFCNQMAWKRSDRRLLFDRIDAGLMEILQPCMGVPAWTKPVSRRIRSRAGQDMIEEDLWMLLVSKEKETTNVLAEKVLGSEMELDLGDDIDSIGTEIERFLFDELVTEFVSSESS
ncbi:hypothetical protein Prudu_007184 [Prunus dulcis]|uniref:DUF4378 domain-containing protein n=1 Tax=Prunus dulcis TaxID=3755 RepID=A0A4Y1R1D4_PRUDU|nr:hypothetical protein Prudu_007184 [Prunus dulcis]